METQSSPRKHLDVLTALYAAFDHFNSVFCSSEPLPTPVINLGPVGKRPYYGWFRANSWSIKQNDGDKNSPLIPEINISPEYLDRGPEAVFETLLHEMAHLKNWTLGIEDCNKAQYHNKKFKEQAEAFGLSVEKRANKGWAKTSLTAESRKAIAGLTIDKEVFNLSRLHRGTLVPNPYITIVLKKDEWADKLAELAELVEEQTGEAASNSGVVKAALELASNYWTNEQPPENDE